MAASTSKTILLEVNGAERPIYEKLVATAAVTPGDLLAVTATVTPLASAGAVNQRAFALENPYAPDPTATAISQDYSVGDSCRYVFAQPGDLVYANIAASQTVVIGDPLGASATGGCLAKLTVSATTLEGAIVGYAEEAVTTSGAVSRIRTRIA